MSEPDAAPASNSPLIVTMLIMMAIIAVGSHFLGVKSGYNRAIEHYEAAVEKDLWLCQFVHNLAPSEWNLERCEKKRVWQPSRK